MQENKKYMSVFDGVQKALMDILDIDADQITPETYLIRELGAESIDLLELAVTLNAVFNVPIQHDDILLLRLRGFLREAEENGLDSAAYIAAKLPFLPLERIREILLDLDSGPAIKVSDLISYIEWRHRITA